MRWPAWRDDQDRVMTTLPWTCPARCSSTAARICLIGNVAAIGTTTPAAMRSSVPGVASRLPDTARAVRRAGRRDRRDPAWRDPELHGRPRGVRAGQVCRRGHALRCQRPDLSAEPAQQVEGRPGRRPDDPGARAPRELHGEHADTAGGAADQHGVPGVDADRVDRDVGGAPGDHQGARRDVIDAVRVCSSGSAPDRTTA
jgi:hypothetical protein